MKKVIKGILLGIAGIIVICVIGAIVSPGESDSSKKSAQSVKESTAEDKETAEITAAENGKTEDARNDTEEAKEITAGDVVIEEAGITIIQNMEFSFHVFDTESWDTVFDSETIYLATNADGLIEQELDKEGQLVLEQDGISVVIKEADSEDSFWGADIYVYVENNSDRNVTVQARSVSINGFMVEPMFSCDVAAGKQAYDSLTFLESDLTENGIESIDNMEISFHVFDTESWDTIFDSEQINVSFAE